jgi:hypothetical protein
MESNKFLSIAFLLLVSSPAQAASVFLEGGLHFGGDTIATLVFVDGSTETINAGELLSGSIGLIGDINEDMELRSSIGIKMDLIFASNGDADFTRFPLEFMLFTKGESVSIGLGLSYHLDPTFTASGSFIGGTASINFDDALGLVAEADYMLGSENQAYLGIKATFIDYETTDFGFGTATISGNSLGVVIGVRF